MKDRVAGAPGQYSAMVTGAELNKMQNGEPFAITLKRDDKPEVEGTPYSKAAVLPDDVAQEICPDIEDPTPADAFRGLAKKKVTVADYIIEQGVTGIWTWRKWASGAAEIFGVITRANTGGDRYLLPFKMWDPNLNWSTPTVTYSFNRMADSSIYFFDGVIDEFDYDTEYEYNDNDELIAEYITNTYWMYPGISAWSIDDSEWTSVQNVDIHVYMIGRWKPLDGEDASKEILAVNIGGVEIDDEDTSAYKTWSSQKIDGLIGDISSALDELHNYAQGLINGGEA